MREPGCLLSTFFGRKQANKWGKKNIRWWCYSKMIGFRGTGLVTLVRLIAGSL